MERLDFRARCPRCHRERILRGPWPARSPAELDRIELDLDTRGGALARCPECDVVEEVALFVDGEPAEAWTDADRYNREGTAGEMPPKPWPDSN